MSDLCKEINKFGKGIGNAARYRIIEALLKGRKTVNELTRIVKLSQPAVSQHLKTLKACDLVIDERSGKEVFYAVNTEYTLKLLRALVGDMAKQPKRPARNKEKVKKNK
jgi:ArsR family transcriptional regulator, arsenate/arsenite/antimonite-responsive transcriptional repressor